VIQVWYSFEANEDHGVQTAAEIGDKQEVGVVRSEKDTRYILRDSFAIKFNDEVRKGA